MLNNPDSTQSNKDLTSNSVEGYQEPTMIIEGLEKFSFINPPQEELELKDQFEKFIEAMRQNEINI